MLRWRAWSAIWRGCRGTALKRTATSAQLLWKVRLQLSALRAGFAISTLECPSCMLAARYITREPTPTRQDHNSVEFSRQLPWCCSMSAGKIEVLHVGGKIKALRVGMHAAQGEAGRGGFGACTHRG